MRLWEDNDKGFCQNILVMSLTYLQEDYVVLDISSIVCNSCFYLPIRASSTKLGQRPILAKKATFFEKKGPKTFFTLYSILFLKVFHQNKAFHNFQKRG